MRQHRKTARLLIPLLALAGSISGIALVPTPVRLVSAQVATASWTITGSMNTNRFLHTATLLPNGKVLVVGGETVYCSPRCYFPGVNSAELYDPDTGAWGYAGSLIQPRAAHSATLLPNGQVLVAGGYSNLVGRGYNILHSAELYDPATENWRTAGSFVAIQGSNSATLLANGKVLAIGSSDPRAVPFNTAELFDPASGTWTLTAAPRGGGITTLLPNGKVLAVQRSSAELYDPSTERWESTGKLNAINADTAILLQNGKVLVTGLPNNSTNPAMSELYEPATGTWSVTGNLSTIFWSGPTLLLPNGRVLMAGGSDSWANSLDSVELYDPMTGVWSPTSNLVTSRQLHTGTLLRNGKVLVVGGVIGNPYDDRPKPLNSAELYDPAIASGPNTVQFSSSSYTVSEGSPRVNVTLTRAGDTNGRASVGFVTGDSAGLNNCDMVNGIASPRCDYINTLGTVQFAAGETSKSFSVAIIDDSYAEGNETFTVGLTTAQARR
jgi:hypothetical protein